MAELIRAYEGKKPYIFVSYSHRDSDKVFSYIERLYSLKYRVWYDEGIAPGSEWPKNIEDHLKGCGCVLVFVSENSLASVNCENEVKSALEEGKEIIEVSLDGKTHPKLNSSLLVDGKDLTDSVNAKYLGDGTGYDREIKKGKYSVLWIVLIGFAIALVVSIGIGLYGINAGWFDDYLPGLQKTEIEETDESEKEIEMTDSGLADILANLLERDDLTQELQFSGGEEVKNCFYFALGLDPKFPLSYFQLKQNHIDFICFDRFYDDYLELLPYLPNLKKIEILGSNTNDFTKLAYCKNLKEVRVRYNLFPLVLPEAYSFSLIVDKD